LKIDLNSTHYQNHIDYKKFRKRFIQNQDT